MSEWQPIETAPKDGTRFLLWRQEYAETSLMPNSIVRGLKPKFHHVSPNIPGRADCRYAIVLNMETKVSAPPAGKYCSHCFELQRRFAPDTLP